MSDIILHHFASSPFAEKVRLALGLKGLAWSSVDIPMVMPKPLLTALTGGYRKTPVMQVGADIYCDTQGIALALEKLCPEPTLFPGDKQALCLALSHWSDGAVFQPGAALSMGTNGDLPEEILTDRRMFFDFIDFSRLEAELPHFFSQFQSHLYLTDSLLQGGGDYLLGDIPGWADILAYFPLWMARGNIQAIDEMAAGLSALQAWELRMRGIGHGVVSEMTAQNALEIAHDANSVAEPEVDSAAWPRGLSVGSPVTVAPHDYGIERVSGRLLRLTNSEVAITREDPMAGEVVVHFPRIGYQVEGL